MFWLRNKKNDFQIHSLNLEAYKNVRKFWINIVDHSDKILSWDIF